MTAEGPREDSLTQWLRSKLHQERVLLEIRHDVLLADFEAQRALRMSVPQDDKTLPPSVQDINTRLEEEVEQGGQPTPLVQDIEGNAEEEAPHAPRVCFASNPDISMVTQLEPPRDFLSSQTEGSISNVEAKNKVEPRSSFAKSISVSLGTGTPTAKSGTGMANQATESVGGLMNSFISTQRNARIPHTRMAQLVTSRQFELFFAGVIFLNMLEMALAMQYQGFENGRILKYPSYIKEKQDVWPGMGGIFKSAAWIFGVIYTIELLLKIIGLQMAFFERWNVFDTFIVLMFYFEKFAQGVTLPIDTLILRMFRLFKVLRLLRLVHEIAGLGQLLLMVTALKGSLQMLAWATMLLFGLQTVFAFILNQLLNATVIENDGFSMAQRQECFKYFGTYSRAILSMFELTLANWIPISRFLTEEISGFFVVFVLAYKLTLGFAVVGVVNACFIKETFKIVNTDRTMMVIEKTNEKAAFRKEMMRFMQHADTSHDGGLTLAEFVRVCQDEHVKAWLGAQGLDASDATCLFELMDDGSGELETQELVSGVAKLKGPARSLDLAMLEFELRKKMQNFVQRLTLIEAETSSLQLQAQAMMARSTTRISIDSLLMATGGQARNEGPAEQQYAAVVPDGVDTFAI
mmetsp:Transcript_61823/g.116896  ORF Transcript_61823/g.116896 Transcript_61823/m.116896 type:complete len:634 (-) Transcript_61823:106-2007(-)